MLRVGLIGIGFMGRGHLDVYERLMSEGDSVKLVALCDIDPDKFGAATVKGNLDVGTSQYDFTKYALYTDYNEMLAKEELDYVDIAVPTHLHAQISIAAMEAGKHVLCEKPMARTVEQCKQMIETANRLNRKLMIGQCLRFWPAYEELKRFVDSGDFGKVTCAYFYRGGGTPIWSYQNWLLKDECSGGALIDQHIHDVDMVNWLFGVPKQVATSGVNVFEGSGYDAVSTNYLYGDGKVVNAQDDWTLNGADMGFSMIFRVNFEKGALIFDAKGLTVYPNGEKSYVPELPSDTGYYREVCYFIDAVKNDKAIEVCPKESACRTIAIAEAEIRSADKGGLAEEVVL